MGVNCTKVQEALGANGGRAEALAARERGHLELCEACRAAGEEERRLAALLRAAATVKVDPRLPETVAGAALQPPFRRLARWLPVAAAGVLTSAGLAFLGGAPGSSVLRLFPSWTARGWSVFAASVGDWLTVLALGAQTLAPRIGGMVTLTAALVAVAGLAGVTAARRWARARQWR